MITGELKSKVDRIRDTMWSGGISNPLSVIEQLTYLLTTPQIRFIEMVIDQITARGVMDPSARCEALAEAG